MTSLFYHDIAVGQTFTSPGRTVTEADHTFFCMLSGDWNPIHVNAEVARTNRFGQRIVSGVYGIALVTGAMTQWGIFEDSAIAMLNLRDWRFMAPIFIGETLTIAMKIVSKRLTTRGDAGIVERRFSILDQTGKTLQEGFSDLLIALAPKDR